MSKPLLLSVGSGKVQEFVGNATGQTPVWSEGADEWVLGTPSSSGGGGVTWYLNKNTAAGSPTTNLPTGASGVEVKNLSATADGTSTTAESTGSVPVLPADPEIIAGFVTDATVPGLTGIPAGLWEFNVWAQASGNTTNQSYIQLKIYKYDGSTAPTFIAESVPVYLYDPGDVTQYTASVLIPAGTSLLTTDRVYVEVLGGSTTSNRQITLHFGNGEPSHVHTTIQVPVNLATGVTGILPVANGGTGLTSAGSSGNLLVSDGSALASLAMSNDATLASTGALTLKNTGTAGTFGSASVIPVFTTDGKGRVTSVTATTIVISITANTSGTLSVGRGGTGATTLTGYVKGAGTATMTASATIPVADVTGAAPIASPTFTGTVTIPAGASISGFATLASPTFTGTPSLPTGTTGVTQSAGNNTDALATTAFVTAAVAASGGAPYDLPFEIAGTPEAAVKRVVNFEAVRPFILATSGHQGGQVTAPSGDYVCTVKKNATTLGTITFASGGFSSSITGTLAERTFAAADVLIVETPASPLGIDTPFATFFMTLA